jgi:hypothetical protein
MPTGWRWGDVEVGSRQGRDDLIQVPVQCVLDWGCLWDHAFPFSLTELLTLIDPSLPRMSPHVRAAPRYQGVGIFPCPIALPPHLFDPGDREIAEADRSPAVAVQHVETSLIDLSLRITLQWPSMRRPVGVKSAEALIDHFECRGDISPVVAHRM